MAADRRLPGPVIPRVVVATLGIAALLGTAAATGGPARPVPWALAWLLVLAGGTLLGGCAWRLVAFRPGEFDDDEDRERSAGRWRRCRWAATQVVVLGGAARALIADATAVAAAFGAAAGLGALVGLVAGPALTAGDDAADGDGTGARAVEAGLAVAGGTALGGLALAGARGPAATAVLATHLLAVGTWIGGAVWHNLIVAPGVRDGVAALGRQARRFRRVVPALALAVVATGASRAASLLGTAPAAYLGTALGAVVVGKAVAWLVLAAAIVRGRLGGPSGAPAGN